MREQVRLVQLKTRVVVLAVLLAAVGSGLTAGSALAHEVCATHGSDIACVSENHHRIIVCDFESDGDVTVAEYYTANNNFHRLTDGGGGGCNEARHPNSRITQFRVCESQPFNCTAWTRVT